MKHDSAPCRRLQRPHVKCTEHGCSRDTKLCLDDNQVVTWPTRRIPDDTDRGEAPGRVANIPRLHHQLSQKRIKYNNTATVVRRNRQQDTRG